MDRVVWTIGHSTRRPEEFLQLLAAHRIQAVADVRRHPGSRRMPQFGGPALAANLMSRDIDYVWIPTLGGRRQPRPDSVNTAWRSASFRGYADHMESEPFAEGLDILLHCALAQRTAVMCAEALWWRCHRGLISDALRWLGFQVCHIVTATSAMVHPYTPAARVHGGRLTYSAAPE
ncbi:MAG: DUF488 family protein [Gemmatimonadales bacterium]